MELPMDLIGLLAIEGEQIVEEASAALSRSRLEHYQHAGQAVGRERLDELFRLTVESIRDRDLVPIMDYMTRVANDRYHAGYTIREVQIAINVLEESIWNHIVQNIPSGELAESLGLVSTVLGAAKDALAQAYVSLASQTKAPSLDLSALFEGRTSG
jgi:hypothetical protein